LLKCQRLSIWILKKRRPHGSIQSMSTIENITVLKSLEVFRDIPPHDLARIAYILKEKEVSPGEEIIREGELGTSMFIIVEGRVRVHFQGKEVAVLGSGASFGELAALDPEPRSASVTALNDALLLELEGSALYTLMSKRPDVARAIIHILCQRVRATLPK
jgi:CRP/FNR family transcriptional regulator, cyclic AMP receptor protein